MARTSANDPLDKFRFRVFFMDQNRLLGSVSDFSSYSEGGLNTLGTAASDALTSALYALGEDDSVKRSGFSEVTLPKNTITEINYRENSFPFHFNKYPGLSRMEPVVFRRGTTVDNELYRWMRKVYNEESSASLASQGLKDQSKPPVLDPNYRKDILIVALSREGKPVKGWRLDNCFPISYKGGNDFNSESNEKLIEELTITYEFFIEYNTDDQLSDWDDDIAFRNKPI